MLMNSDIFIIQTHTMGIVRQCLLCATMVVAPWSVQAQNSTLKSCYLELVESRKRILADATSRQGVLTSLFDPSMGKLMRANEAWEKCLIGKQIPSLDFVTMKGKKYNDSNLRGKVLVLNFWFKSCAPCVAKMPSLNKLYGEFKNENVVFIGFATDNEQALVPSYLNSGRFLFDIVPNSRKIAGEFNFTGYPTTYIVDQKGKIVRAWTGYSKFVTEPYGKAKPTILQLLSHPSKQGFPDGRINAFHKPCATQVRWPDPLARNR